MVWLAFLILTASAAFEVFRWRRAVRLFGPIPAWVPRKMLAFARAARIGWLVNFALVSLPAALVVAAISVMQGDASLLPIALIAAAWAVSTVSRCAQPPMALLLTSSSQRTAALLEQLNGALLPQRVVALIDQRRLPGRHSIWWTDNLRTADANVWKSIVHRLIDIAPVVVIDTCGETRAVAHEASLMLAPERIRKAVFLTDGTGQYPALSANGIDPYEHALRLLEPDELLELLAHCSLGRDYLPWPAELPPQAPDDAIVPEDFGTLPSVLMVGHADLFDSRQLVRVALESGKDLLEVATPWTQLSGERAEYLLNLSWDFVHDRRLAAIMIHDLEMVVVRIGFLRSVGARLPHVVAKGLGGHLSFEDLDRPEPITGAMWQWAGAVRDIAGANGWRIRDINAPPAEPDEFAGASQ